jgi:hypothetical protein
MEILKSKALEFVVHVQVEMLAKKMAVKAI